MCMPKAPKPVAQVATPAPLPPPAPEATQAAPKTANDSTLKDNKAAQGKRSLRINLNLSNPDGTGLSVPTA